MEVSHLDIALLLTPSMSASSVWVSSFFSRKVFIVMPVTYVSIYVTLLYEIIIIRRDKYHNLRCVEKHPAENCINTVYANFESQGNCKQIADHGLPDCDGQEREHISHNKIKSCKRSCV